MCLALLECFLGVLGDDFIFSFGSRNVGIGHGYVQIGEALDPLDPSIVKIN